jgi:L-threonylcarbamoyladenylate synthase
MNRETISLYCDSDFRQVGAMIREEGATCVYPTDTVYALGANPLSEIGTKKCFNIKQRELSKPLPVLLSSIEEVQKFVEFDEIGSLLGKEFWPGKLTLVLKSKPSAGMAPGVLSPQNTIGVRIPDHECCQRLIRACGGALIGTSANLSGKGAMIDHRDAELVEIAQKCDVFIHGECGSDLASSTVLDLSVPGKVTVIRAGAVPSDQIFNYLSRAKSIDFSASQAAM